MTARVLPPSEWPRLVNTELETVWPVLNPETARIFVVEDDVQIIGCWAMYPVMHLDGLWTHPDHRGRGGVARALLRMMRQLARLAGIPSVMTGAISEQVSSLILKSHGVPVPPHFVLPIPKERV